MFKTTITPGFGDIDGLKHVNNCRLPVWFEQARNPFFRMFTPDLSLEYGNWKLIMAHIDFDFIGQLYFSEDVDIRSYILRIGRSSFTIGHEAWQGGRLCVKGTAIVVHYNFVDQKAVAIPDDIRAKLEEHLFEPEEQK